MLAKRAQRDGKHAHVERGHGTRQACRSRFDAALAACFGQHAALERLGVEDLLGLLHAGVHDVGDTGDSGGFLGKADDVRSVHGIEAEGMVYLGAKEGGSCLHSPFAGGSPEWQNGHSRVRGGRKWKKGEKGGRSGNVSRPSNHQGWRCTNLKMLAGVDGLSLELEKKVW